MHDTYNGKPNDGSKYKALIGAAPYTNSIFGVGTGTSLYRIPGNNWVLLNNVKYYRIDGSLIGTTNSSGSLEVSNNSAIFPGTGDVVWTGFEKNWGVKGGSGSDNFACDNWSVGSSTRGAGLVQGANGVAGNGDNGWLYDSFVGCAQSKRIYCAQQ